MFYIIIWFYLLSLSFTCIYNTVHAFVFEVSEQAELHWLFNSSLETVSMIMPHMKHLNIFPPAIPADIKERYAL